MLALPLLWFVPSCLGALAILEAVCKGVSFGERKSQRNHAVAADLASASGLASGWDSKEGLFERKWAFFTQPLTMIRATLAGSRQLALDER